MFKRKTHKIDMWDNLLPAVEVVTSAIALVGAIVAVYILGFIIINWNY